MTVTQPLRLHSEAFKQSLIEACGEPDAAAAVTGSNANQLRRWMRDRGIEPPESSCLPLRVTASERKGGFVPIQLPPCPDTPRLTSAAQRCRNSNGGLARVLGLRPICRAARVAQVTRVERYDCG